MPQPNPLHNVVTIVFGKASPRRRWWLLTFVVWASAGLPLAGRVARATALEVPTVTIAIDDYAGVPADEIDRAQCLVTQLYAAIGVKTDWLETRRVSKIAPGARIPANVVSPDLRIIVLGQPMPHGQAAQQDAVGSAPGTKTERGRIAYVFYDRLQMIALTSHQVGGDTFGVVIAHEIGHLLLPYGSHSETGLMRGLWRAEEIQRVDVRALGFTPSQARDIRQRVSGAFSAP